MQKKNIFILSILLFLITSPAYTIEKETKQVGEKSIDPLQLKLDEYDKAIEPVQKSRLDLRAKNVKLRADLRAAGEITTVRTETMKNILEMSEKGVKIIVANSKDELAKKLQAEPSASTPVLLLTENPKIITSLLKRQKSLLEVLKNPVNEDAKLAAELALKSLTSEHADLKPKRFEEIYVIALRRKPSEIQQLKESQKTVVEKLQTRGEKTVKERVVDTPSIIHEKKIRWLISLESGTEKEKMFANRELKKLTSGTEKEKMFANRELKKLTKSSAAKENIKAIRAIRKDIQKESKWVKAGPTLNKDNATLAATILDILQKRDAGTTTPDETRTYNILRDADIQKILTQKDIDFLRTKGMKPAPLPQPVREVMKSYEDYLQLVPGLKPKQSVLTADDTFATKTKALISAEQNLKKSIRDRPGLLRRTLFSTRKSREAESRLKSARDYHDKTIDGSLDSIYKKTAQLKKTLIHVIEGKQLILRQPTGGKPPLKRLKGQLSLKGPRSQTSQKKQPKK